ncbi:MAG: hypothetical protein WCI31_07085 [Prolixibacteraceae bacterium]
MAKGIPLGFSISYSRLFICMATVSFLLSGCFSKQPDKKPTGETTSAKSDVMNAFRLSQITVPGNAAYNNILEDFDRNDLQNIDRALIIFTNNKADSLSRDSMLVSFNEFMTSVMQEYYSDKLLGNRKLMEQFENKEDRTEAQKMSSLLASHAIQINYHEGDFYLEHDMKFVLDHLNGVLTASSKSYLQTKINLSKGFYTINNQPVSPPDSLALQIVALEDFMLKFPEYVAKDEIQSQYIDVLTTYLSGMEQLPLFTTNTKMLEPAYQNSYLQYIENYPKRESTKTIKKFYELLTSKGFKYDESFDSFLSEINFTPSQNPQ